MLVGLEREDSVVALHHHEDPAVLQTGPGGVDRDEVRVSELLLDAVLELRDLVRRTEDRHDGGRELVIRHPAPVVGLGFSLGQSVFFVELGFHLSPGLFVVLDGGENMRFVGGPVLFLLTIEVGPGGRLIEHGGFRQLCVGQVIPIRGSHERPLLLVALEGSSEHSKLEGFFNLLCWKNNASIAHFSINVNTKYLFLAKFSNKNRPPRIVEVGGRQLSCRG